MLHIREFQSKLIMRYLTPQTGHITKKKNHRSGVDAVRKELSFTASGDAD